MKNYQTIEDNDLMSVDGGFVVMTTSTAIGITVGAGALAWAGYKWATGRK